MKKKISVKGKEYSLEQNVGMIDSEGNVIIPKEYDRIIQEADELFAAVVDNPDSRLPIDQRSNGIKSALTGHEVNSIWNKDVKQKISAVNIDFYSTTAKFKYNKKVLVYYYYNYSETHKPLVLLDENYTWSIAYIDYEKHEIIEDEKWRNISEIRTISGPRFLIKQNDVYKVISFQDRSEFELPENIIEVEDYEKGLIIKDHMNEYGFMNYSGEQVIPCVKNKISLAEDYIKVENMGGMKSIWSYEGKEVVPSFYEIFLCYIKGERLFKVKKKVFECDPILYGLNSPEYGTILEPEYSHLEIGKDGTIIYCKDDKYGLAKYDEDSHRVIDIMYGYNYMKFNHHGHIQRIIVRKRFKYAVYDTDGSQVMKFRYRWFIPKRHLWMYDYFEWLS